MSSPLNEKALPSSVVKSRPSSSKTQAGVSAWDTSAGADSFPTWVPSASKIPQPGGTPSRCPVSSPTMKRPLPSGRRQTVPFTSRPTPVAGPSSPSVAFWMSTSSICPGPPRVSTSKRRSRLPSVT